MVLIGQIVNAHRDQGKGRLQPGAEHETGRRQPLRLVLAALLFAMLAAAQALSQQQAAPSSAPPAASSTDLAQAPGKLLLVLPFENQAAQPNLDWIGAAVPEILNRRLASAGFLPISRGDRA